MQLKVFIFFAISCMGCGHTQSMYPFNYSNQIDDPELNYINKYIIEHTILFPIDWDVNPVMPLNDTSQVDIVIIQLHEDYRSPLDKLPFFKEETIDSVILNLNSHKLPFLFAKKNYKILKLFGNFPDKDYNNLLPREIPQNSILFALGHVYQIDAFYYIPIVYLRKDTKFDYWHLMSRVYKFEVCTSGFINFISFYYSEINLSFKENVINSIGCK